MTEKVGRNDPCPCGSGKKYKLCCFKKSVPGKRKFTATPLSKAPKSIDLMERTYGNAIARTHQTENPADEPAENKDGAVTL